MEQQPQLLELYRAGLRSAADVMQATLQQTQRLHQQQLEFVRIALEENERSGNQIAEAKTIDDMMGLNSRLAGAQIQRITEFWSTVWRAAAEAQKLMADQIQVQVAQASNRVRQGYDLTARASEEAARLAAAQMSETANQLRETIIERERHGQSTAHAREHAAAEPRRSSEHRKTG
jgi:hypothetical protein